MKNLSPQIKHEQYFTTDHLKADLKSRSVRGGAITMLAQILKFSLTLGSNMLLGRLLTPQDYGLVGMVTAVTGFVTLFKDLGLSMATIQKDEINHQQVSTLFWVNLGLSGVTAIISIAIAPLISSFYQEPRLMAITLALAAGFIISGLGIQHSALLNRQMQYRVLMVNDVCSNLLGIICAIVAAWYGWGYWALVIMPLVNATVNTIGVWITCQWRPGLPTRRVGVRSLLVFGGHLTGFSIVNYFARHLDNILIGRYWGAQQLGQYAKAYQLLLLPLNQINVPITNVAIPSLSRLQNEPDKFRDYYLKALSAIAFLTMPITTLMIVVSEELIGTILGSQWGDAIKLFRILSISALFQPICNTTGWLYISRGKSDRMLKWGVFYSSLVVISFLIGLPYQAYGVALSYGIVMLLQVFPCIYFATRGTSITVFDVIKTVREILTACIVAGATVLFLKTIIGVYLPMGIALIIYCCVMTVVYLLFMFYVFNHSSMYLQLLGKFKAK
ncbi:lipopolysaccharide biosynthesis protein [Calothrix sp. NIES-3974]|uniref:lipopolysaccharide biosynthesis protein n=1 Tax=Calothrix sp. NIES-3974 TaxID=2005462 RepID=UPI000B5E8E4C|nr:lipopolysaccharide biosynthesis protein [Calothrix sp. NIES-3974]BAZ06809.1 putative polysaccharide export transporter [Calothrix sp. NIES-3974]